MVFTKWLSTGWRKPIGFRKLQVIFRKKAADYRALLQKMKCGDMACYGSSPPCTHNNSACDIIESCCTCVVVGTGLRRPIGCHIPTFQLTDVTYLSEVKIRRSQSVDARWRRSCTTTKKKCRTLQYRLESQTIHTPLLRITSFFEKQKPLRHSAMRAAVCVAV